MSCSLPSKSSSNNNCNTSTTTNLNFRKKVLLKCAYFFSSPGSHLFLPPSLPPSPLIFAAWLFLWIIQVQSKQVIEYLSSLFLVDFSPFSSLVTEENGAVCHNTASSTSSTYPMSDDTATEISRGLAAGLRPTTGAPVPTHLLHNTMPRARRRLNSADAGGEAERPPTSQPPPLFCSGARGHGGRRWGGGGLRPRAALVLGPGVDANATACPVVVIRPSRRAAADRNRSAPLLPPSPAMGEEAALSSKASSMRDAGLGLHSTSLPPRPSPAPGTPAKSPAGAGEEPACGIPTRTPLLGGSLRRLSSSRCSSTAAAGSPTLPHATPLTAQGAGPTAVPSAANEAAEEIALSLPTSSAATALPHNTNPVAPALTGGGTAGQAERQNGLKAGAEWQAPTADFLLPAGVVVEAGDDDAVVPLAQAAALDSPAPTPQRPPSPPIAPAIAAAPPPPNQGTDAASSSGGSSLSSAPPSLSGTSSGAPPARSRRTAEQDTAAQGTGSGTHRLRGGKTRRGKTAESGATAPLAPGDCCTATPSLGGVVGSGAASGLETASQLSTTAPADGRERSGSSQLHRRGNTAAPATESAEGAAKASTRKETSLDEVQPVVQAWAQPALPLQLSASELEANDTPRSGPHLAATLPPRRERSIPSRSCSTSTAEEGGRSTTPSLPLLLHILAQYRDRSPPLALANASPFLRVLCECHTATGYRWGKLTIRRSPCVDGAVVVEVPGEAELRIVMWWLERVMREEELDHYYGSRDSLWAVGMGTGGTAGMPITSLTGGAEGGGELGGNAANSFGAAVGSGGSAFGGAAPSGGVGALSNSIWPSPNLAAEARQTRLGGGAAGGDDYGAYYYPPSGLTGWAGGRGGGGFVWEDEFITNNDDVMFFEGADSQARHEQDTGDGNPAISPSSARRRRRQRAREAYTTRILHVVCIGHQRAKAMLAAASLWMMRTLSIAKIELSVDYQPLHLLGSVWDRYTQLSKLQLIATNCLGPRSGQQHQGNKEDFLVEHQASRFQKYPHEQVRQRHLAAGGGGGLRGLEHLPLLRELDLSSSLIDGIGFMGKSPTLEKLNLSSTSVSNPGLVGLSESTSLKVLVLFQCPSVSSVKCLTPLYGSLISDGNLSSSGGSASAGSAHHPLGSLGSGNGREHSHGCVPDPPPPMRLEVLDLRGTSVGTSGIAGLGLLPRLRSLRLGRTKVTHLETLADSPSLTHVDLENCTTLHPEEGLQGLESIPTLSYLNLTRSNAGSLQPLAASRTLQCLVACRVASLTGRLRDLFLRTTADDGLGGVGLAGSCLWSLLHLDLSHSPIDASSVQVLSMCVNLQYVNLSRTSSLTSIEGLEDLPHLREIHVAHTQIASVNCLGNAPSLERLNAAHTHIEDEGIAELHRAKQLQLLDLTDTQVSRVGHLHRCPCLKVLLLTSTLVSSHGLQGLEKSQTLEELYLNEALVKHFTTWDLSTSAVFPFAREAVEAGSRDLRETDLQAGAFAAAAAAAAAGGFPLAGGGAGGRGGDENPAMADARREAQLKHLWKRVEAIASEVLTRTAAVLDRQRAQQQQQQQQQWSHKDGDALLLQTMPPPDRSQVLREVLQASPALVQSILELTIGRRHRRSGPKPEEREAAATASVAPAGGGGESNESRSMVGAGTTGLSLAERRRRKRKERDAKARCQQRSGAPGVDIPGLATPRLDEVAAPSAEGLEGDLVVGGSTREGREHRSCSSLTGRQPGRHPPGREDSHPTATADLVDDEAAAEADAMEKEEEERGGSVPLVGPPPDERRRQRNGGSTDREEPADRTEPDRTVGKFGDVGPFNLLAFLQPPNASASASAAAPAATARSQTVLYPALWKLSVAHTRHRSSGLLGLLQLPSLVELDGTDTWIDSPLGCLFPFAAAVRESFIMAAAQARDDDAAERDNPNIFAADPEPQPAPPPHRSGAKRMEPGKSGAAEAEVPAGRMTRLSRRQQHALRVTSQHRYLHQRLCSCILQDAKLQQMNFLRGVEYAEVLEYLTIQSCQPSLSHMGMGSMRSLAACTSLQTLTLADTDITSHDMSCFQVTEIPQGTAMQAATLASDDDGDTDGDAEEEWRPGMPPPPPAPPAPPLAAAVQQQQQQQRWLSNGGRRGFRSNTTAASTCSSGVAAGDDSEEVLAYRAYLRAQRQHHRYLRHLALNIPIPTHLAGLNISGTIITDLGFMCFQRRVRELRLSATIVRDLTPLRFCTALQLLDVSKTRVLDLSPLKRCRRMRFLYASDTFTTQDGIRCLPGLPQLEVVDLSGTPISSILSLRSLPQLRFLRIRNSAVPRGESKCFPPYITVQQ
eukprot:gene3929-2797_t